MQHCYSRLLLLFVLTTVTAISYGKDMDGDFVVFGVGEHKCINYLTNRKEPEFEYYREWLSGYLSAFNVIMANTYDIMGDRSYRQIINWLNQYCRKNQQEYFVNAMAELTSKLYPARRNIAPNKNTRSKWLESGNLFTGETKIK